MAKDQFPIPMISVVILLAIIAGIAFWEVLDMVLLGLLVAVVAIPAQRFFTRYMRPSFAATLISLILFTALVLTVLGSVSILSANSALLREQIHAIQGWVMAPATDFTKYGIPVEGRQISDWIDSSQRLLGDYWMRISQGSMILLLKVFTFFASLTLFLWKGEQIQGKIMAVLPGNLISPIGRLSSTSSDALHAIFVVHIIMALVTFAISIPFFMFLGYGNVLFYSFLTFLCELVPVLGASVTMIYLGGYSLAVGDMHAFFILLLIGYPVVALAPEIFIRPVLTGRRVQIHPLVMLVGFFGGILTMGMIGFVLGPLILVLLITGYRIMVEEKPLGDWLKGRGDREREEA
ncbi:MAG: AI-2E family transporter [Methanoregulaceae archaeon]